MLYVKIENGKAVSASNTYPGNENVNGYENRNDWNTIERAERRALELSTATGGLYIATDSGPHVSPRFDIIQPPVLGDKVSYSFNGDSYPDGTIVKVSKSLKVVKTDTGSTYYRRKNSGSWVKSGGTWSLIQGWVHEQNPHF